MRIFIGIPLSNQLQEEIISWQQTRGDLPVRWIAGKNLHVTLVPPWPLDSARDLRELAEKLRVVYAEPFEIAFDRVGLGPDPKDPRLIWAQGQAPKDITDLRSKINEALGQQPESRPFRLHATLARFRSGQAGFALAAPLSGSVDWRERVDRFVIFRSRLSPEGADYEILEEFMLK